MKLAIVIPFYKIKFFEETLASLAEQSNRNFNLYIGNDDSPYDPTQILNNYNDDLNITYKEFEENLGEKSLIKHWERCLEMVQEEKWIMILGDDDLLSKNVVESWYRHFDFFKKETNVVRFYTRIINENSEYTSKIYSHPKQEKAKDSFYRRFKKLTRSSLSEYIFLKDAYKKNGFTDYPLAWHSDDKAWLDFSGKKPIYTINEALILIRNSDLNISGKSNNLCEKQMATIMFYRDVISRYFLLFNKSQRYSLLRAYEGEIMKNGSLNINEFFFLLYKYFLNLNIIQFKRFLKRNYYRIKLR